VLRPNYRSIAIAGMMPNQPSVFARFLNKPVWQDFTVYGDVTGESIEYLLPDRGRHHFDIEPNG
jgi:hypothetical protein